MLKRVFALLMLLSMLMPIAACGENAESAEELEQVAMEAAMLMGFTPEQLERLTLKMNPFPKVESDIPQVPCCVFECPDDEEYDALRSCSFSMQRGIISILFNLQPLMDEEAFQAIPELEKTRRMLLTIMEQLPWLEYSGTEEGAVYAIEYYTSHFEDMDDLPKYFTWKQTRVYKAGIDHPLAGKIVEISYYPQSESIDCVQIIPFQ